MDELYRAEPARLSGMDDLGNLSAWYVFSSIGFYPVRPELPFYQIGSPLDKITINMDKGKTFVIKANNVSDKNKYVQSATLNDESLNKPWFKHSDIIAGGRLVVQMGSSPNKEWGSAPSAAPPSIFADSRSP